MPNSLNNSKAKPFIILGVDPGYERIGFAVLEKTGSTERLLYSECFRTEKESLFEERLFLIGEKIESLIENFKPQALSIENLFVSKNQKTAMRVAEVRGCILYIARKCKLIIGEYTPLQVKIAVTGYGKSEKAQVEMMVRRLLDVQKVKMMDDEMDAIAIALTGSASLRQLSTGKR